MLWGPELLLRTPQQFGASKHLLNSSSNHFHMSGLLHKLYKQRHWSYVKANRLNQQVCLLNDSLTHLGTNTPSKCDSVLPTWMLEAGERGSTQTGHCGEANLEKLSNRAPDLQQVPILRTERAAKNREETNLHPNKSSTPRLQGRP